MNDRSKLRGSEESGRRSTNTKDLPPEPVLLHAVAPLAMDAMAHCRLADVLDRPVS